MKSRDNAEHIYPHLPKFVKTQVYRSTTLSAFLHGLQTASLRFRDRTESIWRRIVIWGYCN